MRFETTIRVGGYDIPVVLPRTTEEVLDYRSFIAPRLQSAIDDPERRGFGDVVEWATQWVAEHCAEWDEIDVDTSLTTQQVHIAGLAIVAKCGTIPSVAEEIYEHGKVWGKGGCNCPKCEDPEGAMAWDGLTLKQAEKACKFTKLSMPASQLIGTVHSLEGSDLLRAPFYLYDARERFQVGIALGRRSERVKEEKIQKNRDRLENSGVLTKRRRR